MYYSFPAKKLCGVCGHFSTLLCMKFSKNYTALGLKKFVLLNSTNKAFGRMLIAKTWWSQNWWKVGEYLFDVRAKRQSTKKNKNVQDKAVISQAEVVKTTIPACEKTQKQLSLCNLVLTSNSTVILNFFSHPVVEALIFCTWKKHPLSRWSRFSTLFPSDITQHNKLGASDFSKHLKQKIQWK